MSLNILFDYVPGCEAPIRGYVAQLVWRPFCRNERVTKISSSQAQEIHWLRSFLHTTTLCHRTAHRPRRPSLLKGFHEDNHHE